MDGVEGSICNAQLEITPQMDIVIAGGGLAGLALVLGLQERNIQAHVFESHPVLSAATATIIGIGSNGITALEGIKPGLTTAIAQAGAYTTKFRYIASINGKEEQSRTTRMLPDQWITVRWESVQRILASFLHKSSIYFSHKLIAYKPFKGGVEAYFRYTADNLEKIKMIPCKLLIGADGIWSVVRKQMVGDPPRHLNLINWNALVYDPDLKLFDDVERGDIIYRSDNNGRTRSIIANTGDYTMWLLRKKDETGELASSLVGGKATLGAPGCKSRALKQLDGVVGWDNLRVAIEATSEEIITERKMMDRLPINKWSDADGHVLLIGDAAHAQYTGPGQGARTAFEDAHQLSLLLEVANTSSLSTESIDEAVGRFEELRIPRMKKMQEYAAYQTMIPEFQPDWTKNLTTEERERMNQEYRKWVEAYPDKQQGDPESFYYK
uniref:FAD-binding domain-containing protein n=1 Tax=Picea sitchensis TaxID=3332 RepID=B8LKB0_PICSI|nr:unknown [Picea sitchensis]